MLRWSYGPRGVGRLMVVVLVAGACAKKQEAAPGYAYGDADEGDAAEESAVRGLSFGREPPAPSAPPAPSRKGTASGAPAGRGVPAMVPADPVVDQAQARMVHYSGYAKIRVEKVETATDRLVALAQSMGGFAEKVSGGTVTVRVPVARFDEAMTAVLEYGEVLDKNLSAQDVTEAFQSVELRLQTARNTLSRLQALLAKSTEEEEKLALVREIQRVSEQIDLLTGQSRTLAALADFSRITVLLVPREPLAWRDPSSESQAFAWISRVSPFFPDVLAQGKRLDLPVPTGLVELDVKGRFVAESADGARMWSGRLDNEPVGDGAFWAEAVHERLGRDFSVAERSRLGRFEVVRLVDRGSKPYVWYILVHGGGKDLEVVQVYYPTAALEGRYHEAVKTAVLEAGGGDT